MLKARGAGPGARGPCRVPGVNRMTEVTISEQMTRMTRRAIAIPFQFLCGGLLPTSSCRHRTRDVVSNDKNRKNTVNKSSAARMRGQGERRFRRMLNKGKSQLV